VGSFLSASKIIEIYIKAELLPLKQNIQNNFESTFKSFKTIFFSPFNLLQIASFDS
jgi:hypothetical protein